MFWRMSTTRDTAAQGRTSATFSGNVVLGGAQRAERVPMAQLMRLVDFESLSLSEESLSSSDEDALDQIVKGVQVLRKHETQQQNALGVTEAKELLGDISFDSFEESSDEAVIIERDSSQMSSLGLPLGIEDALFGKRKDDDGKSIHPQDSIESPVPLVVSDPVPLSQASTISSIFQASLEFLKAGLPKRKAEECTQIQTQQHEQQRPLLIAILPPHKVIRSQARPFSTLAFKDQVSPEHAKAEKENAKLEYRTIQLATQKAPKDPFEEGPGQELKTVKPIVLSKEQEHVLALARDGVSLFFTGSAGTGKSLLLRTIIKDLKRTRPGKVAITASTGLAACNIGGQTLHSFAGVGLGKGEPLKLLKYVRRNRAATNRWKSIDVLIIDEVSMIDPSFFDSLDYIARKIRHSNKAFGGIQLIICGDFYQLPPVVNRLLPDGSENPDAEVKFAFEANSWGEALEKTIVLREVFRQKGDQKFIDMLNQMREGQISDEASKEFQRLSRPLPSREGIVPSMLFATRREVDGSNNARLAKLEGKPLLYTSIDGGSLAPQQKQTVLSNILAPKALHLKKGAQVMCIKNIDSTIINGTLGQVIDFVSDKNMLSVNSLAQGSVEDGLEKEIITEANAIEIESQSAPANESDFIFADFENREITQEMTQEEMDHINRKKSMCQEFSSDGSNGKMFPLVRFLMADGVTTRTVVVYPEKWTVEDEKEEILASRVQLPLILAWSLSIHKSQGQTLQSVIIDLRRVFEAGQTYVGLSRAISRESVQVIGFEKNRVRSHPKVVNFYRDLQTAEEARTSAPRQRKIDFFSRAQDADQHL